MKITSMAELKQLQQQYQDMVAKRESENAQSEGIDLLVGMATCGIAAGAKEVYQALEEAIQNNQLSNVNLVKVGCIGSCYAEPTVMITQSGKEPIIYGFVDAEVAKQIIEGHVLKGEVLQDNILLKNFVKA